MQFKEGLGWKAAYNEEKNLYGAEVVFQGSWDLFEISADIFNRLGKRVKSSTAENLIKTGRCLYSHVNDRCGPPYTVVLDSDYRTLCPWAHIVGGDHVWPDELTDATVEIFPSEANNREQRRKKRAERLGQKGK